MTEEKTCEVCGDYKGTEAQVRAHGYHCKRKLKERVENGEIVIPKISDADKKVSARKERIPFGSPEQKWGPREKDGFHYRVFNDNWRKEPGRVQRAIAAGYEVVDDEKSGGNVGTNDDGSEIKGILMRKPMEFHEEDMAKREEKLKEIDKQLHGGEDIKSSYGSVKIETSI